MFFLPFCFLGFLYFFYQQFYCRRKRFPPGPIPLPIIGNFHQIDLANPHRTMIKWRKIYGPVFTVWLPKPIIVLANHKVLQEALVKHGEAFSGRPTSFLYSMFTGNREDGDGIILCQKERWAANRAFALRVFKDFGMGKNLMEEKIALHVDQLIKHIEGKCGKENECILNVHHPIAFCVGNIIHHLVMGKIYPYGDAEFEKFKKLIDFTLEQVASFQLLMCDRYPFFSFLFPLYRMYKKNGFALQNFFLKEIEQHKESLSEDGEPKDFMEAYLREMNRQPNNLHFNRLTLALTSGDLWTGGMETTVTTLRWGIIYMLYYPTVQRRLHMEIDEVLQSNKPSFVDRLRMPFLMATITELQRIVNVLPWSIPHRVLSDTTIHGEFLPVGTDIMPQFGAIHMDDSLFPQAEVFKPERFISKDGKFQNHPNLNPFGIGKRACLGENLARFELFLIFTTLMQHFEFIPIEGRPLPSLERSPGMTSVPKEFECRIRRRGVKS